MTLINKSALDGAAHSEGVPEQVVQAWEQALPFTLPPQWSIPGNIKAWGVSMIASCERCIISGFPWSECKKCGTTTGTWKGREK